MKLKFFIFFAICIAFASCYPPCERNFNQPFEMTLKVVDQNDNPLPNKQVKLFITQEGSPNPKNYLNQKETTAITTNSSGLAVFSYNIPVDCDFTHVGLFLVNDESTLLAVNAVSNEVPNSQKKATGLVKLSKTIQMDSLTPFKMRIVSNKFKVSNFSSRMETQTPISDGIIAIERSFQYAYSNRPLDFLDTTINTKVYSKSTFFIKNSLNGTTPIIATNHKIERDIDRSAVYLEEIK
jgi:hypothetical protein